MRLRVDPPELRNSLLVYLEAAGCLIHAKGGGELEAQLLNSVSERHDRQTLAGHLASWKRANPAASVEVIASTGK
jgi:hypothetical protein